MVTGTESVSDINPFRGLIDNTLYRLTHRQSPMDLKDLLPGLPVEIARECLLRVPYQYHPKLKTVCQSWKTLLESPCFYLERKESGTAEECICLIQPNISDGNVGKNPPTYGVTVYNTVQDSWKRIDHIPFFLHGIPPFCQCVSHAQKLILLGGWDPVTLRVTNCVFIYNFLENKWSRGANMSRSRAFFACAADGGKIYVSGGHDDNKDALKSAEVYSIDEDRWETISDMVQRRDEPQGAFVDGKFYVISGYTTETQGEFDSSAEIYDPVNKSWEVSDNMWTLRRCPRSCIVAFGKLVHIHGHDVMQYNAKENVWDVINHVPESLGRSPCATVLNDKKGFFCHSTCGSRRHVAVLLAIGNGNVDRATACGTCTVMKWPENVSGFVYSACTIQI